MAKRQIKEYSEIVLQQVEADTCLDFSNIFGRSGPVHIEVGSGKGTFLVNQAAAEPEVNFLGIEWANKYYRYAVDRLGRWQLKNVRMLRDDAADFISAYIADCSVDCFHVYFPDPWPKARHHKRRFISAENVEQMFRCLKDNGTINIATDHAEYFEWMCEVFDGFTDKFTKIDFVKPAGAGDDEYAGTNFERKYLKEKREIYTMGRLKKAI